MALTWCTYTRISCILIAFIAEFQVNELCNSREPKNAGFFVGSVLAFQVDIRLMNSLKIAPRPIEILAIIDAWFNSFVDMSINKSRQIAVRVSVQILVATHS